jgi:predicted PurR-regulated permease PerM
MSETDQHHGPPQGRDRRRRAAAWRSTDVLRTAALVIAMYLILRLLWFANPLVFTAFLGLLFGLAVSSGVDRLTRFGVPRGVGAPLIVLVFLGLLVGVGAWVAPTLRRQAVELRYRLPQAVNRLSTWIDAQHGGVIGYLVGGVPPDSLHPAGADAAATAPPAAGRAPAAAGVSDTTKVVVKDSTQAPPASAAIKQRIGQQFGGISKYFFPFISSTLAAVAGFLIIVFLSIYIAADPGLYHSGIMHLFPHRHRKRAGEVLSAMAEVLRRWLITQMIAMLVIGSVATITLLIIGVKAAFALGVLAGLFEFIPTAGPILSALPAVAMAFLDSPEKALSVALAYMLMQFLENHLLIPLLMKGGVDLPPVLTILAQALMALVFGFLGLMCAVPALAAIMVGVKMLYVHDVVGDSAFGPDESPAHGTS